MSSFVPASKRVVRPETGNFRCPGPLLEGLEPRVLLSAPGAFQSVGIGGGGALFSPSISPYNANELFMPTDMGELFHTTDFGLNWTVPDYRQAVGNAGSNVQFTSDPNVLYVMNYINYSPTKSTDGGKTWQELPGWTALYKYGPTQVLADPHSTQNVWVSYGDSYRSPYAIYFSSDGGATFRSIYTPTNQPVIAGLFTDGPNMYLGTNEGLLTSTNGGANWSMAPIGGIPADQAMFSLVGAKEGSTVRLFASTMTASAVKPGVNGSNFADFKGLYSWQPGQSNWTSRSAGLPASALVTYLGMSSGSINVIWASGLNAPYSPGVWRSTDGGQHWSSSLMQCYAGNGNIYTTWMGDGVDYEYGWGGQAQGFTVAPTDPSRAIFTNLGFAWGTVDGGVTWHQMLSPTAQENPAGQNGQPHEFYSSSINPTGNWALEWLDPKTIMASFTDINGVRSIDGGQSWQFPNWGSVGTNTMYKTSYDRSTGKLYAAISNKHDLYQSFNCGNTDGYLGRVTVSTDNGASWSLVHDFGNPVLSVLVDPNVPNRLYALVDNVGGGLGGMWVSSDIDKGTASTWTHLSLPARANGHPWDMKVLSDGTRIMTCSAYTDASGYTATSGIFVQPGGTGPWLDRSDTGMQWYTQDVYIDPQDATQNTWYVAVHQVWSRPQGVYKTTDRGLHWTQVFSDAGVESMVVDPQTHEMYLATAGNGLYYSANADAAVPTFKHLDSFLVSHPIRVYLNPYDNREVWVATWGGGTYVGRTDDASTPAAPLNLTATTAGPTQINLQWSSDAPQGNGFHVESSTDGVHWNLVGTVHSLSANSFWVTGLTSGKAYSFRVKAFNSFGDSAASNVAVASTEIAPRLIAYEGFGYSAGGALGGKNGGTGWATAWSSGSNATVAAGSLTAMPPADSLTTSGQSATTTANSGISRTTTETFDASGTVLWASATIKVDYPGQYDWAKITLGDLSIMAYTGVWSATADIPGNTWYFHTTHTETALTGQTYFVVVREAVNLAGDGKDNVQIFINPPPGSLAPDSSQAFINETISGTFLRPSTTVAISSSWNAHPRFDELRLGATYADIAPGSAPAVAAPTGLAVAPQSPTTVRLDWVDNASNELGFHIQSSPDGTTWSPLQTVGSANANSFTLTDLSPDTQYYFRVSAFGGDSESAFSSPAGVRTSVAAPAAPTGLSVTVTQGQFNLHWDALASTQSGFVVQSTTGARDPFGNAVWTNQATVNSPTATVVAVTLPTDTLYTFRVCAFNATARTASTLVSAVALQAPTSLVATASGPGTIELRWSESIANEKGFYVQQSRDGIAWQTVGTDATANLAAWTVSGLLPATTYAFRVNAYNDTGDSAYTNVVTATTLQNGTLAAYEGFNYPTGMALSGLSGGTGWAGGWTAPTSDAVTAGSLAAPSPAGTLLTAGQSASTTLDAYASRNTAQAFGSSGTVLWASVMVKVDYPFSNYDWATISFGDLTIRAYAYDNTWSATASNSTAGTFYFHPVRTASAMNGNTYFVVVREAINLAGDGKDNVQIYVNPAPGSTAPDSGQAFINETISGTYLRPGATVAISSSYWAHPQFDEIRIGASYADVAPVPASVAAPAGPTDLTATVASSSQIDLHWTDHASNESGFRVEWSTDGQAWSTLTTINTPNANGYSATNLTPGTYFFRVAAVNAAGVSLLSNTVSATTRIPGDANGSGLVDQDDYKLWYDNYGTGTTWEQGNFKGSSVTDQEDYKTWYDKYGAGTAGGAAGSDVSLQTDATAAVQVAAAPVTTGTSSAKMAKSAAASTIDVLAIGHPVAVAPVQPATAIGQMQSTRAKRGIHVRTPEGPAVDKLAPNPLNDLA